MPVILSGGSGTRLWPLSTTKRPKQFHALNGDSTLFAETLKRLSGELYAPPVIVCNEEHIDWIEQDTRATGINPARIILEPVGRNTAPAIALAAVLAAEVSPDTLMLVAASDSAINDMPSFERAVRAARDAAETGLIATFGLKPTRPETGYGYIRRGEAIGGGGSATYRVSAFVEKPDQETAQRYLEDNDYTWNSSMFLFRAGVYLSELERQRPDILEGCQKSLADGESDGRLVRPGASAFAAIRGESIDYAVMENCSAAAVVEADFGWSDIGSWQALWEISPHDAHGNVRAGRTVTDDIRGCLLRADADHRIAVVGCSDLVIVVEGNTVLVAPRERSQEVKNLATKVEKT
ncbi:MAG: mannose-1-phosphate guanylyltransferase/mannose-6-phosphate isomerase [Rhodospirillales bacterium]